MKKLALAAVSRVILSICYVSFGLISSVLRRKKCGHWRRSGRILVIGTFHNPNWFHAHIGPLARSGVEVILVCDEPVDQMDGVTYACPPVLLSKIITRAAAKFVWAIISGIRYSPDLYMGYNIFPAAQSALVVARLFGRPACYQATCGALELEGGGWHAENRILCSLDGPSKLVERLVFASVREFDLIVVRGTRARQFIRQTGYRGRLAIITGSVKKQEVWQEQNCRETDVILVGRLTEYKRPDRFISVVAGVARQLPKVKVWVAGEGPDLSELQKQADELGVAKNIEFLGKRKDVPALLAKSKVFVLTSRWEGLAIAMIEAMTAGTVPVVSDVGDLRDLADDGTNGYVVQEDDIDGFARRITRLLTDESLWRQYSLAAVNAAVGYSSLKAVSERWRESLQEVITQASICS